MKLLIMLLMVVYTPDNVPTDGVGTFPIELNQGEENSTIIYWTIVDDTTVKYENIYFDAKDIYVTEEDSINANSIIKFSNSYVWNETTLEEYDITDVTYYLISDGVYEAELFTINGFSKKIKIYVVDEEEYNEIYGITTFVEEEEVYSNNFVKYIKFLVFFIFLSLNFAIIILIILMTKNNKEFFRNMETYLKAKGIK